MTNTERLRALRVCRMFGHDWRPVLAQPGTHLANFKFCGRCKRTERIRSPAASAAPRPRKEENTTMNITITIDGVVHEFSEVTASAAVAATPAPLSINRKFVVYDVDGNRVDGYKYESRALRNNKARFAGTGFWLGKADSADFTWVPA